MSEKNNEKQKIFVIYCIESSSRVDFVVKIICEFAHAIESIQKLQNYKIR